MMMLGDISGQVAPASKPRPKIVNQIMKQMTMAPIMELKILNQIMKQLKFLNQIRNQMMAVMVMQSSTTMRFITIS
jgi:hypothetical protein